MFGVLGPALLLAVMSIFGWRGYTQAMRDSDRAVMEKVQDGNTFAVQFVASGVAHELERYYRSVENPLRSSKFINLFEETVNNEELTAMLEDLQELNMPLEPAAAEKLTADERARLQDLEQLREKFADHPARQELQEFVEELLNDDRKPVVASWIITDAHGTHVASAFPTQTTLRSPIGRNFAWRSYFNGTNRDQAQGWRPPPDYRLPDTHLSGVFLSSATNTWKVAISTPIVKNRGGDNEKFLGVFALTVEMGRLLREFEGTENRFAVLVEGHEGPFKGVILQHPLFEEMIESSGKVPDRFSSYRVKLNGDSPGDVQLETHYADPLGQDIDGRKYARPWIMAKAPVMLPPRSGRCRRPSHAGQHRLGRAGAGGLSECARADSRAWQSPGARRADRLIGGSRNNRRTLVFRRAFLSGFGEDGRTQRERSVWFEHWQRKADAAQSPLNACLRDAAGPCPISSLKAPRNRNAGGA